MPSVAAVLTAVAFLQVASVMAAEPVVFRPTYASAPADNPLKGFVPYAGQGRKFPHSLEFDYLSLASMMNSAIPGSSMECPTSNRTGVPLSFGAHRGQKVPASNQRSETSLKYRHLIAPATLAATLLPYSHAAAAPASAWKVGTPIVGCCLGSGFPGGPAMDAAAAAQLAEGDWSVVWCGEKDLDVVQRHELRAMPAKVFEHLPLRSALA